MMQHPNIVKIYDFYFEYNESAIPNKNDRLFLIMGVKVETTKPGELVLICFVSK